MRIRTLAALPLSLAALSLAACTLEPIVSGTDLAEAAEDIAEDDMGVRPEIDCGEDDIVPEVDKEVDCTLTDPDSGEEVDAVITFTSVDGDEWGIGLKIDDGASEAPSEPADEATSEQPAAGEDTLDVPARNIAAAAGGALKEQLGSRPEIDCGQGDITIYTGSQVFCTLTDPATGLEYDTTITITSVEGRSYNFDVQVADTPN